ncbi:hypothetical protein B0H19DRAFT_4933 [Mycena capillaripes]|nr:hypothetical protein B0H19DRAFT_4933 [Mycena capillaripes]
MRECSPSPLLIPSRASSTIRKSMGFLRSTSLAPVVPCGGTTCIRRARFTNCLRGI